ncbi:aminoglycoside phosphotransferase family protein [Kribbella qitaiheensis]|uniref:aminoglycoside phosphotransferase family protein n=1 Tax=Kribbella qitaiheensis TaxID=1544730 RepID=UPI0036172BC3
MDAAIEYFEQYAGGPVQLIGQGMEGVVYDLGGGEVGKVWFGRQPEDVRPLQAFLAELSEQDLPFRTPDIVRVDLVDGRAVSIETKLLGTPLSESLATGAVTRQQGLDLFADLVEALGRTTAGQASKALPLIGESTASWRGTWGETLAGVVDRRAAASRHYLQKDINGFDELLESVQAKLKAIEPDDLQILHGDICPPNLLIDGDGRIALLDWGFLTTAGDNTFDASTAAGFFDMYGPDARLIDDLLLDRFEAAGHSRERMYLYRAAYAITTATIYSPDASDGHYLWCVNNLNRADLRDAV